MSGDWIKMRVNLWDDPRIGRIVDMTGTSEATVIGALYWLWSTADQHTEDGCMPGMSMQQIDRKTGVKGFAEALVDVCWLRNHDGIGVVIAHFEEHNGTSAKKRSETAKRVAKHRCNAASVTDALPKAYESATGALDMDAEIACNTKSVTGALARDREEKSIVLSGPSGCSTGQQLAASVPSQAKPTTPPPTAFFGDENIKTLNGRSIIALAATWELPEAWGIDAEVLGWKPAEVLRESEKFRQYWVSGKGSGKRRSVRGWRQSWSNWLAKAEGFRR